jgi:hypothetical protein
MSIELGERRSGLMAQQHNAGRLCGCFSDLMRIDARIIGAADKRELPIGSLQPVEGRYQIELALVVIDPCDHEQIAAGREVEWLQRCCRADPIRPIDPVGDDCDRHVVGPREIFCQTGRDGDAAIGKRHAGALAEP